MNETIGTTSLIEIRDFLGAHQCAPAPWENPKNVIDRFYTALCEKRNDERFWAGLKDLMNRLEDRRFDAAAMRGSEALHDATMEKLLDDLRAALDPGGGVRLRTWLNKSLGATAILAFLLLGTSLGCFGGNGNDDSASVAASDDDFAVDDDSSITDDEAACEEAADNGVTGVDSVVYCDLVDIIMTADISNSTKTELLDCLPGLGAEYREYLLELFQSPDMTDQDIADYLEQMMSYGDVCDPYYPGDDDDH